MLEKVKKLPERANSSVHVWIFYWQYSHDSGSINNVAPTWRTTYHNYFWNAVSAVLVGGCVCNCWPSTTHRRSLSTCPCCVSPSYKSCCPFGEASVWPQIKTTEKSTQEPCELVIRSFLKPIKTPHTPLRLASHLFAALSLHNSWRCINSMALRAEFAALLRVLLLSILHVATIAQSEDNWGTNWGFRVEIQNKITSWGEKKLPAPVKLIRRTVWSVSLDALNASPAALRDLIFVRMWSVEQYFLHRCLRDSVEISMNDAVATLAN